MSFVTKQDLPISTIERLEAINAQSSGLRTAVDAAFLAARLPYLTNQILLEDPDGMIVLASGNTVPTGEDGFKVGALFIDVDSTAVYFNSGTTSSATWNNLNSISSAEIAAGAVDAAALAATIDLAATSFTSFTIEEGTPVNAVAAAQTLTLTGVIVPGSHAESVVTSDATNVAEDETLTIGSTVYRFRDTLAQAYDVKIGASAAITLDNLKAAINASGTPGTEYFTGTLAHPTVVATDNNDTTQKVVARVPGTAANTAATTTTASHLSFPDTTLGGGTGTSNPGVAPETVTIDSVVYSFVDVLSETNAPAAAIVNQVLFGASSAEALDNLKLAINAGATAGTNYSTGTVVHPTVTADANDNTSQVVTAKVKGTAAESIAVDDSLSNGAWGDTNLAAGVDGTVGKANEVLADATYLYHAVAANTVADTNWRRISLGSAY
jgi:hypothetical protein